MATSVESEDALKPLKAWLHSQDDADGRKAISLVSNIPEPLAKEALEHLLDVSLPPDSPTGDTLISILLRRSAIARKFLASRLHADPTCATFYRLWDSGDASTDAVTLLLIDPEAWASEEVRVKTERNVFMLCLAKLMEAGLDHPDRALRPISRLLAREKEHLTGIVDGGKPANFSFDPLFQPPPSLKIFTQFLD